jgi:diaminohydroxyphosphoribosylaminopyrimidine deaminase/5-amino-6-(5-phosphoribosylamino)uracil reductase
VNLEPCSHYGKTPPCSDLIIVKKIPEVIIGCLDPNPLVAGNGVKKLTAANCKLQIGILEIESKELNKRFITYYEKKRPYIILKWAQTTDGFIAPSNGERINISNDYSRSLLHRWRSEEAAVMVGTNTALFDNPKLNARDWNNQNPVRVVLDRELKLSADSNLFDYSIRTIVVTEKNRPDEENLEFFRTDFSNDLLRKVIDHLYQRQLQSVLVEGGAKLLQSFIREQLWDEGRIFIAPHFLSAGISAPDISGEKISEENISGDRLIIFKRNK